MQSKFEPYMRTPHLYIPAITHICARLPETASHKTRAWRPRRAAAVQPGTGKNMEPDSSFRLTSIYVARWGQGSATIRCVISQRSCGIRLYMEEEKKKSAHNRSMQSVPGCRYYEFLWGYTCRAWAHLHSHVFRTDACGIGVNNRRRGRLMVWFGV